VPSGRVRNSELDTVVKIIESMVKILVVSIRHPTKTVFGKCITTYPQRVSRNGTEAFIYVNKAY
jgi:hypothetical protein